jgi:hypothetical protein
VTPHAEFNGTWPWPEPGRELASRELQRGSSGAEHHAIGLSSSGACGASSRATLFAAGLGMIAHISGIPPRRAERSSDSNARACTLAGCASATHTHAVAIAKRFMSAEV